MGFNRGCLFNGRITNFSWSVYFHLFMESMITPIFQTAEPEPTALWRHGRWDWDTLSFPETVESREKNGSVEGCHNFNFLYVIEHTLGSEK